MNALQTLFSALTISAVNFPSNTKDMFLQSLQAEVPEANYTDCDRGYYLRMKGSRNMVVSTINGQPQIYMQQTEANWTFPNHTNQLWIVKDSPQYPGAFTMQNNATQQFLTFDNQMTFTTENATKSWIYSNKNVQSATQRGPGQSSFNQTFEICNAVGGYWSIANGFGKALCTYTGLFPDKYLPWVLKYNKLEMGNSEKVEFRPTTKLFFDHDPAWNGMASWILECADLTPKVQKIASIFSWLIIAFSTVPSFAAIPLGKLKKGAYKGAAKNLSMLANWLGQFLFAAQVIMMAFTYGINDLGWLAVSMVPLLVVSMIFHSFPETVGNQEIVVYKIGRIAIHVSGWLYLQFMAAYILLQDLLEGQKYFFMDFIYFFIFYAFPLTFFFLLTLQGRDDRSMKNAGKEQCVFYLPLLFLAPCWFLFLPYALYQDVISAQISFSSIGEYSPIAMPAFLNIFASNWMIIKSMYDHFGGVFEKNRK